MERSDKLVRLLLDQVDEHAFTFLDPGGRFVEWSAGATEVYGYTREEVLGQSGQLIFTREDAERGLFEHELEVARSGGRMEDDRWMLRKDGQKIWVTGVVKGLRDERGGLIGYAKVMRNRTDLKTRTEALESEIVGLRTRDEHNRKLFAVIAHELRNPLAPIINVAQLLRTHFGTNEHVATALGILERQVDALSKLVLDLVDMTRASVGKIHCEMIPVELGELLRQVADGCRSQIEEHGQRFWLHVPPTPIMVKGDPVRLRQVFSNLLVNAIKYTPDGGNIYLRATTDGEAVVTVEDTGMGIPPELLPRIFELFTQEDDPENRTRDGLGIGLALVKDLVSLHGGSVQAKSDGRGKGSMFIVQLPVL